MPVNTIRLPNGRSVRIATYVNAWRVLRAQLGPGHSPMHHDSLINGWDHFPTLASDVLRDIRFGLHDRINQHIPGYGVGRKWDSMWQTETMRTARAVNTPRLAVRWVPHGFRARLAHRLNTEA